MSNTNFQTFHQMGNAVNDVIRQATGRRPVENIDMDYVTVAQNKVVGELEYSGSVVAFNTGRSVPIQRLKTAINPVQDLHGQDAPYPPGGGKNLFDATQIPTSHNGITATISSDGTITLNGTATAGNAYFSVTGINEISTNGFAWSAFNPVAESGVHLVLRDSQGTYFGDSGLNEINKTVAMPSYNDCNNLTIYVTAGTQLTNFVIRPMLEKGSTPSSYAPYSNICSITGWTESKITLAHTSDPDDPDKEVVTTEFQTPPGTVYGGTLDVVSGKLTTTMKLIDLGSITWYKHTSGNFYAENAIAGRVVNGFGICSQYKHVADVLGVAYLTTDMAFAFQITTAGNRRIIIKDSSKEDLTAAEFKTAMTGVQLVYRLEVPEEYQLTPQEMNTLVGDNVIYSDSGDVDVMYYVMKEFD